MREITSGQLWSMRRYLFDLVCDHEPVLIVNKTRPSIIMTLKSDYDKQQAYIDQLEIALEIEIDSRG